jgi:hypothetical protein
VLIEAVRARDMRAVAMKLRDLLNDLIGVAFMPAKYEHMDAPDFGVSISDLSPPG